MVIKKIQKKSKLENRRRVTRIAAGEAFELKFKKGSSKGSFSGEGKNLSVNGMRFATETPVKDGEKLDCVMSFAKKFPGVNQIRMTAEVVRVHLSQGEGGYRVACKLNHEKTANQEVLRQFMWWWELKSLLP